MEDNEVIQRAMDRERRSEPYRGYVLTNEVGEVLAKGTKKSLTTMRSNCEMTTFRVAPQSTMEV